MEQWLTGRKIPVGDWGEAFFDVLTDYFAWFFEGVYQYVNKEGFYKA